MNIETYNKAQELRLAIQSLLDDMNDEQMTASFDPTSKRCISDEHRRMMREAADVALEERQKIREKLISQYEAEFEALP